MLQYIETIYTTIVVLSCLFVAVRTHKLYKLSGHEGIGSFRNAFIYMGLAFIARYVMLTLFSLKFVTSPTLGFALATQLAMIYLYCIAGFSLVYSLVWKGAEKKQAYLVHLLAIGIAVASIYKAYFLYFSQLAVFGYAAISCYSTYRETKQRFIQVYFIALILAFAGYLANLLNYFLAPISPTFVIYTYGITVVTFLIFVYGVIRAEWLSEKG
ncbi:MAG: hypothetical protein V1837_01640 [Candidatus Woesearchaeota archaeon]